jgi:hypothetical protein
MRPESGNHRHEPFGRGIGGAESARFALLAFLAAFGASVFGSGVRIVLGAAEDPSGDRGRGGLGGLGQRPGSPANDAASDDDDGANAIESTETTSETDLDGEGASSTPRPGAAGEGDPAKRDDHDVAAPTNRRRAAGRASPQTVILPAFGRYRAPKLLRLAGRLTELPVRVERRALNDVIVEVPIRLGRRPVDLVELRILLAAHSLFLFEWDHPEHGALLVATDDPDWSPKSVEYRVNVRVPPERWNRFLDALAPRLDALNASLPEDAEVYYAALPLPQSDRVLIVGPAREPIERAVREATSSEREVARRKIRIGAWVARHRRVEEIYDDLGVLLGEDEIDEARIRIFKSRNTLLFRGDDVLTARILRHLEELDDASKRGTKATAPVDDRAAETTDAAAEGREARSSASEESFDSLLDDESARASALSSDKGDSR